MQNYINILNYNTDREYQILAILLNRPELIETSGLRKEDFYNLGHQNIFNAMVSCYQKFGDKTDLITVSDELEVSGKLKGVGGRPFINDMALSCIITANFQDIVKLLKDLTNKRQVLKTTYETYEALNKGTISVDTAMAILQQINVPTNTGAKSYKEYFMDFYSTIDTKYVDPVLENAPKFRHDIMKHYLFGLLPGQLYAIAGRPSSGKSALMLDIAEHIAFNEDKKVAIFSIEMTRRSLTARLAAKLSNINSLKILFRRYTQDECDKICNAMMQVAPKLDNFIIEDFSDNEEATATLKYIKSVLRKDPDITTIFIDHVHLMDSDEPTDDDIKKLTDISKGLKQIAKKFNIPVVVLIQLNRNVEQRNDKHPVLSDLRGCGAFEQDIDTCIMIYRDDYYNPESKVSPWSDLEAAITKNRDGATGIMYFKYWLETGIIQEDTEKNIKLE